MIFREKFKKKPFCKKKSCRVAARETVGRSRASKHIFFFGLTHKCDTIKGNESDVGESHFAGRAIIGAGVNFQGFVFIADLSSFNLYL